MAPIKKIITTPKSVYYSQQMSNVVPVTQTSHPAPPSSTSTNESNEQQQPVQDAGGA